MKKNIVVIWDDIYHPIKTYEDIVSQVFSSEWNLITIDDARMVLSMSKSPDLVVNFTIGRPDGCAPLSAKEQMRIKTLVENGMGMMYVHAGLACVEEDTPIYEIARGRFASHPEPHFFTYISALPGIDHPLLKHFEPFGAADEHYFCKVDVEKVNPFLCSISQAGTEIAGWTQNLGLGRVACLTPGHTKEMLHEMKNILGSMARWCVGED